MKIVGVMMLHNEDMFARQAATNIRDFCDEILVIDNDSTDDTVIEVRGAGVDRIIRESDLTLTHEYVQGYSSTNTWVFGVDGDELYDPEGLRELRPRILSGEFASAYQLKGWYLHVTSMEPDGVDGYLGPPSHNPTKLYNFLNLAWPADGTHILFQARPRTETGHQYSLTSEPWESSTLRCLHMRFLQRSAQEPSETIGRRLHGEDKLGFGSKKALDGHGGNFRPSYRRGSVVTTDAGPFFRRTQ